MITFLVIFFNCSIFFEYSFCGKGLKRKSYGFPSKTATKNSFVKQGDYRLTNALSDTRVETRSSLWKLQLQTGRSSLPPLFPNVGSSLSRTKQYPRVTSVWLVNSSSSPSSRCSDSDSNVNVCVTVKEEPTTSSLNYPNLDYLSRPKMYMWCRVTSLLLRPRYVRVQKTFTLLMCIV